MSDLIKRLEELSRMMGKNSDLIHDASDIREAVSLIRKLERNMESAQNVIYASGVQLGRSDTELATERALSDRLYDQFVNSDNWTNEVAEQYRKSRPF